MSISKISILASILLFMSSCGLSTMSSKYETVNINVTPSTLQVHGDKVGLTIDANFPEKYFAKNATIDFTPVLVFDGGEAEFKTITVQGESAIGGEATIFYANGGSFSYQDKINYSDEMLNSELELRATGKSKDKEAVFPAKKIASGVLATSKRIENTENILDANSEYEYETILEETATIYFLVNASNIRSTEKSNSDLEKLEEFAKLGNKTHSIEVKSFASPEGSVNLNDNVSDKRAASTLKYAKRLLKKVKLDGASNNELYVEKSEGEDWEGFNELMRKSEIKDKRRITKIVNSVEDLELRERAIRDMAEIYDAIEKNVLPQLRKAQITVRSYQPKKSDSTISVLANSSPNELSLKELLHAASLSTEEKNKIDIYNKAVQIHNNWKGLNNIATIHLNNNDLDKAYQHLSKAEKLSKESDEIKNNLGVVAAWKGQYTKAQNYFNKCKSSEKNQALLSIRKGDYKKASRYFKNKKSHNAALAKILNGNNSLCNEKTAACDYLNAISSARSGNNNLVIKYLKSAIDLDSKYKNEASMDLEFIKFKENTDFQNLLN
ncbi:MAG: TPR end-of-group domain-containing protein [Flavobacteriales bacterium]|jgi:Flp pilus assembly protein TadD/outer membrane protein OmpA-like peptidoglycan-associated protein|tara:strand:- start:6079 stop:7740 length:1662 start_codon:yes stop_codon:yes gene_type:complete